MSGSLSQLEAQSAAADQLYGLPIGTTYAVAGTESSYGTNLGSRGNIFQFGQAETAQYGSGNDPNSAAAYLSSLYNGPAQGNLAAAYTMYQNGATGYANGATTPQYTSSSPFAQFLQTIGYGPTGSDIGPVTSSSANGITGNIATADAVNSSEPATTTGTGGYGGASLPYGLPILGGLDQPSATVTYNPLGTAINNAATPAATAAGAAAGSAASSATSWLGSYLPSGISVGGGLLALILLTVGLIALIIDKHPATIVTDAAKKLPLAA